MCERVIEYLSRTWNDQETPYPLLAAIVPWYDTISRKELRKQLQALKDANIWKKLMHSCPSQTPLNYITFLRCTGIVVAVCVDEGSDDVHVFDDHQGFPHPPSRAYAKDQTYMHLVATERRQNLRWVPCSELTNSEEEYKPITIFLDSSEFHISRVRDLLTDSCELHLWSKQVLELRSTIPKFESEWHILCAIARDDNLFDDILWMTDKTLVNAITGEARSNELDIDAAFGQCWCDRNWSAHYSSSFMS